MRIVHESLEGSINLVTVLIDRGVDYKSRDHHGHGSSHPYFFVRRIWIRSNKVRGFGRLKISLKNFVTFETNTRKYITGNL